MSQAVEFARKGSIYATYKLHDALFHKVPFPTTSAKPRTVEDCAEFFYSNTIKHGDELQPVLDSMVAQIASGIRADYGPGVSFSKYPMDQLRERFSDAATYRAEVMGVAGAIAVRMLPEAKGAQVTFVVCVNQWLPK